MFFTLTELSCLQVSISSYVLDFRAPVSPAVALATMCAVHADKALVSI